MIYNKLYIIYCKTMRNINQTMSNLEVEDHQTKMKLLNIEFTEHYKLIQTRADSKSCNCSCEYCNSQEYLDNRIELAEEKWRDRWKDERDDRY